MQNQKIRSIAVIASTLVLTVVFVSSRAHTFHYCAGYGERAQGRIAGSGEVCGPDEKSMEWGDRWREQGMASKVKMLGSTVAAAFGAHSKTKRSPRSLIL
jgi:hypothetical protein